MFQKAWGEFKMRWCLEMSELLEKEKTEVLISEKSWKRWSAYGCDLYQQLDFIMYCLCLVWQLWRMAMSHEVLKNAARACWRLLPNCSPFAWENPQTSRSTDGLWTGRYWFHVSFLMVMELPRELANHDQTIALSANTFSDLRGARVSRSAVISVHLKDTQWTHIL